MSIINLTPHPITLPDRIIPPSGQIARVAVTQSDAGQHGGIPLVRGTYGQVQDLPEPSPGVLLVVSAMVRSACPDRSDLASPARMVRDATGAIVGCDALEIN